MFCSRCIAPLVALAIGTAAVAVSPTPAAESTPIRTQVDSGVASTTGLVVSTSSIASDIGAAILRKGGNAVDAAVATAFALAVTHPSAGNIGGGGFMVVRLANGEATTIDYRERAPLASTQTMYLDSAGNIVRNRTSTGYLAPGVPGTVRGMEVAHKRFGKLPWRDVVMPAVELAEKGFVLGGLANSLNGEVSRNMTNYAASVAAYGKPGGGQWAATDTIVLRDLGKTLRAIATEGPDVFYKGWIADLVDADMRANGGLISKADLAAYEAKVRAPIRGSYRGYEIISMPPPSSGGVALVQMLNIVENHDLKAKGRYSPATLHVMIEAMRRAYVDRARHLGDPDFVQVPVQRLTDKAYAKTLSQAIDLSKATNSLEIGKDILTAPVTSESDETTHFSVIDKDGNAVSNTYTLEGGYGSHVVVKGAGFLLNNEMGDFNKKPGYTWGADIGTPANLIAPGKRMLSSMTPTIVTRDGKVVLVTGSPGGRTIINTVFNIVLNVAEFGMNGRQAVDAQRMHHQWMPNTISIEANAVSEADLQALRAMGHEIRAGGGSQGDGHSIFVDLRTGTAYGANDKRSRDSKASK